ncbi:prepilin-type cleavage/methylation domain-containing protein [Photobacterium sanctipauli]|uniref:Prepilin-type cleavage/methylation domain-containing protein n=1 Tax=Photobacterium sanctipauli TaxID=1342794 RepID=A0A2T3N9K7_9GAMM|nr:prepilin-type N-terminal cleavage/methylation domain-containing protein [Photobacterium sanctipauli]PSW10219.1 prepilin-type cleavage/methylation domain-containing protein [Photobacterium sanctipauli]
MPRHQRGFTLIEVIVVIVLIGIISVTAASRIFGRSSFDAYLARDQAISIARQIQLLSMNQTISLPSDDPSQCYSLVVRSDYFGSLECASNLQSSRWLSSENDRVSFSVNESASAIYFDILGRPFMFDGTNKKVALCQNSGCEVTVTARNNEQAKLCINSEGYMWSGGCS